MIRARSEFFLQRDGPLPQLLPEVGLARVVPGAVGQSRPMDFGHLLGQIPVVVGIAIQVGKVGLIKEAGPFGHGGDALAGRISIRYVGVPGAIGLLDGVEPGRELDRDALRQGKIVPIRVFRVKGPAEVQHVDAKVVEDLILGLGELLNHVIDAGIASSDAQVLLEVVVGNGRDAGAGRAAQIDRHAIRFLVPDAGQDSFPGCHRSGFGHEFVSLRKSP